jgi:antitoxin PrlF
MTLCIRNDIANHPERLQAVDATMQRRINSLVGKDVEMDLDALLAEDDE